MQFNTYLFIGQFLIFFSKNRLVISKAIIGANLRHASSGAYSYVVSIMVIAPGHPHSGGEHICTGSLISRKDVLTSEHCMLTRPLNEIQLVIGTIDIRNGSVYYPFFWISHDQWTVARNITLTFSWNDILIIRLILSVPQHLIPVRLSRLSNTELYNAEVKIVGWGTTSEGIVPDIMQIADARIIENRACEIKLERVLREVIPVNIRLLCSYVEPYILVGSGDSGGPLIFRNRIVAVNYGVCPDVPNHSLKVNLHFGTHYYREFISFMKNLP